MRDDNHVASVQTFFVILAMVLADVCDDPVNTGPHFLNALAAWASKEQR